MANAAPPRVMAPMQMFMARAVAPEGGPVGVTVEPVEVDVPVDVEVDDTEDSSVMLKVATQGLALSISAWLHPRSAGGNRKVVPHSHSISQPGHAVAT